VKNRTPAHWLRTLGSIPPWSGRCAGAFFRGNPRRTRADTIRRYVIRNGLNINSFQDYGWDKVMLK